ncbi:hypothetical protein [Faecalibacterium sp. An121]|uniref:hypothetical protein n=1 Tax=Faecalibacterium sp. An121 TaxID=1965550 RepID=UPI000B3828D6|nr:hypothetical protein [Faecalibacterium sp. An121]OUQ33471.1 hypothetical protein B5E66_12660 [Faecalibacterium sp. An121]
MKLKKIASLALAGIMAVSMLAGCKSNPADPEDPNTPIVPSASDLTGYMNDLLSSEEEDVLTFSENATLNTALKDVALDKDKVTADDIKNALTNYTKWDKNNDTLSSDVIGKFTTGNYRSGEKSEFSNWLSDTPTNAEKSDTYSYVEVRLLSGKLTEQAVAGIVHDYYDTYITGSMAGMNSGKDVTVDGSIGAVKVANNSNPDASAWVVAVMFTKTVSESANAQV